LNEVQTRSGFYYVANFARLQGEYGIFELLLHIALAEEAPGTVN